MLRGKLSRFCFFVPLLFSVTWVAAEEPKPTGAAPQWIWAADREVHELELRRSFSLDRIPDEAVLTVATDFASFELELNGLPLLTAEAHDPVYESSVAPLLREGENHLVIRARAAEGPSAVAARLRWTGEVAEDGETVLLTGPDWELAGSSEAPVSYGEAHPLRFAPAVLPEISAAAEYNQWKEALEDASVRHLSGLPEGFVVEEVRVALEEEGSWVSLLSEGEGRFLIGREDRGILRAVLDEEGGAVVAMETLDEELAEVRGMALLEPGTLYANANRLGSLHRLRDRDGDGRYDESVLVRATPGSPGHGRNALVLGPDGAIHGIHGDSIDPPEGASFAIVSEPGRPRPLGHWLTLGPDGGDWLLLTAGLRNPYGIDFNPDGEAFTYDADNEGDLGLPFYRPTRVNHLVPGGNYGWWQRPGNDRSLPVYAPDSLPTTYDVGRGSPTGVRFGTASHFPEPWRSALFALDWAYGRIVAVHFTPHGASYAASGEVFLEGRPLNVTDLAFGAEGSLYFVTGGRKTRSALYRVRFSGGVPAEGEDGASGALPSSPQAREREAFSESIRAWRRSLAEAEPEIPLEELPEWRRALGSEDPWLRHAARLALERRPVELWRESVLSLEPGLARLTGLLALARQGGLADRETAINGALSDSGEGEAWGPAISRTCRLTVLRIAELALDPALRPVEQGESEDKESTAETAAGPSVVLGPERVRRLAALAGGWMEGPEAPVTREAARILSLLDDADLVDRGRLLIAEARTQEDRLHYLELLSRVTRGWTEETRRRYFELVAESEHSSNGDRFMPPFFEALRRDALASAPEAERETLAALLEGAEEIEEEAPAPPRPFVRQWSMEDFSEAELAAAAEGDPVDKTLGETLFRAGQCHLCHPFGPMGRPIGPDLSLVGRRFSPGDLLESILDPSAVVAEVYRTVSLVLDDGNVLSGRLLRDDFRQSTLYLATNPFSTRELTAVPKDRVRELVETEHSPMPAGLLSSFEREEVLALLAWLARGPGETP